MISSFLSVYCTVPHEGQTLTKTCLRNLSSYTSVLWLQSGINNFTDIEKCQKKKKKKLKAIH